MLDLEKQYYNEKVNFIAGTDEAGRGCLLGPVVASAVIFPKDFFDERINDSKKLNEKQREELFDYIIEHALAYSVCEISPEEIDEINILEASRKAMEICIQNLNHQVDFVFFPRYQIQVCFLPQTYMPHAKFQLQWPKNQYLSFQQILCTALDQNKYSHRKTHCLQHL